MKNIVNEAPIDYEGPERMEPGIERQITQKQTPFHGHPSVPEQDRDFIELVASKRFKDSVDKVKKYFILSETEQKQIEKNKKTISKIKKLSENITQEVISRKFFEKNPSSELIGKTNKKNLVFKLNEEQIRITPNGKTI